MGDDGGGFGAGEERRLCNRALAQWHTSRPADSARFPGNLVRAGVRKHGGRPYIAVTGPGDELLALYQVVTRGGSQYLRVAALEDVT